ncbi:hypothetical protein KC328_g20 [Hortaea werneckii]|nr:hypothetical protein KC328_g20 [Hortaea werneckii]
MSSSLPSAASPATAVAASKAAERSSLPYLSMIWSTQVIAACRVSTGWLLCIKTQQFGRTSRKVCCSVASLCLAFCTLVSREWKTCCRVSSEPVCMSWALDSMKSLVGGNPRTAVRVASASLHGLLEDAGVQRVKMCRVFVALDKLFGDLLSQRGIFIQNGSQCCHEISGWHPTAVVWIVAFQKPSQGHCMDILRIALDQHCDDGEERFFRPKRLD